MRFWWSESDDEACVFFAMLLLIPVAFVLFVVTAPIWLPLCIARGLYLIFKEAVSG